MISYVYFFGYFESFEFKGIEVVEINCIDVSK